MAYSKQTWDTTSYVNPTRMNHIEDGIESASTATGTEYSSGVSVKEKIDSLSYYHVGDTFETGWLQWIGLVNSATRFEFYLVLPKAIGSDVNSITLTGSVSNLRVAGTQITSFTGWGGSINSRSGIANFYVDGSFSGKEFQAGQISISNFKITFGNT